jgi:ATP synthase protein I
MTTTSRSRHPRRHGSTAVLAGAALMTLVLGGLATVLGGLLVGRPAAYGSLVGTAVVVGVFGLGALVVDRVAGALPSAALLVALMTYTLQVVLLAALFLSLSGSGLLDDALDRQWLAGTIVVGTFVWLGAHLLLAVRARIPAYELPATADRGSER